MATFVIKRLADGKFYKNGKVQHRSWQEAQWAKQGLTPEQGYDRLHWTPDLQAARTYTNQGGAKSALPYKANETDYAFVEVELRIVGLS